MLVGILSLVADMTTAFGLLVELWARRHNVPLRQSQALAMEAEYPLGQCPVAVIIDKIILICISTYLRYVEFAYFVADRVQVPI